MAAPLLLVAILLSGPALTCQCTNDLFQIEKPFCGWECITFALMWPGAFCVGLKKSLECNIPQYIQSWTIHGLWPMYQGSCCSCWPIFPSDLEELEPEISHLWPTLLKTTSNFTFWKNEWIKHGSCAACVEGMNSPTRYFQRTLKLRGHFDIDRALMDAGIKPSCNKTYQFEDLHSALAPIIGDKYEIQCLKDDEGRELLIQVKISLFRNFTLGCHKTPQAEPTDARTAWKASEGHPCPKDTPVFYFPISYEHPHDPCD